MRDSSVELLNHYQLTVMCTKIWQQPHPMRNRNKADVVHSLLQSWKLAMFLPKLRKIVGEIVGIR